MEQADFLDAHCEDPRWEAAGLESLAARAFAATFKALGMDAQGYEVALLACDDARIASLNADFRDKPRATNVLSWPSAERAADVAGDSPDLPAAGPAGMPCELGDIAIAYDTCAREAAAAGKPLADHTLHLCTHGLLHLLGYDHICDEDAALMEGLEARILASLGLDNPYE